MKFDNRYPIGCVRYDYKEKIYILRIYGTQPYKLIGVTEAAVTTHGGSVLDAAREEGFEYFALS